MLHSEIILYNSKPCLNISRHESYLSFQLVDTKRLRYAPRFKSASYHYLASKIGGFTSFLHAYDPSDHLMPA